MLRRKKRSRIQPEINIVPLLDVLLVLVLALIASSTVITQSITVDLPNETISESISENDHPVVILEVLGIDQYNLVMNHDYVKKKLASSKQVIEEVRSRMTSHPKTVFLIGGDKKVPYDEIVKAIHLLYQAGVKSVGLMTQPI